jgi:hypothetical protein
MVGAGNSHRHGNQSELPAVALIVGCQAPPPPGIGSRAPWPGPPSIHGPALKNRTVGPPVPPLGGHTVPFVHFFHSIRPVGGNKPEASPLSSGCGTMLLMSPRKQLAPAANVSRVLRIDRRDVNGRDRLRTPVPSMPLKA